MVKFLNFFFSATVCWERLFLKCWTICPCSFSESGEPCLILACKPFTVVSFIPNHDTVTWYQLFTFYTGSQLLWNGGCIWFKHLIPVRFSRQLSRMWLSLKSSQMIKEDRNISSAIKRLTPWAVLSMALKLDYSGHVFWLLAQKAEIENGLEVFRILLL